MLILAVWTVEVIKVYVVKVVANCLLVELDMLSVAAKQSQWRVLFDTLGTLPYKWSWFGKLLEANRCVISFTVSGKMCGTLTVMGLLSLLVWGVKNTFLNILVTVEETMLV